MVVMVTIVIFNRFQLKIILEVCMHLSHMRICTFMCCIIFKIPMNSIATEMGFKKEKYESKLLRSLLRHRMSW